MDTKMIIGMTAGVLTAVSTVPQIIKLIKDKQAQAVSPVMFFVLLAGNLMWCWYGIILKDIPIISTNTFASVCDMVMIYLNYKYSDK